jgi:N-acetyl sugar amidotransferase
MSSVDWAARWKDLENLCEKYRSDSGEFDCIVPCSGGKDGSYVNYKMKHELSMKPLALTIRIPLIWDLGELNLKNFISSGYDHMYISPNPDVMRELCRIGFIELGFPLWGWQIALQTAIAKVAVRFKIPLVIYGEDGEVEYGGSTETKNRISYSIDYTNRIYFEGNYNVNNYLGQFSEKDLYWFLFPSEKEMSESEVVATHWSYFENWDLGLHYSLAKKKCGLQERPKPHETTYQGYAQNDTPLYDLHCYLMFLKFGFGRCSQDVGNDIRRGALTREEGIRLVRQYDHLFPEAYLEQYLDYYGMTNEEFDAVIDKFANKALLKKNNGRWVQDFEIR